MFSSRSKTSSAVMMTPERQWMPLEGRRPPPSTETMLLATRSTSSAAWSENARRGLPGSTMMISRQAKIACWRYDVDTNSLLLAEWLVSDFPRQSAPKLQWLGGPHEPLNEVR